MKKLPVLVSYAYARGATSSPVWEYFVNSPHIELLLDCGAFTAKTTGKEIKLEDYCSFLDAWGDKLFAYLALDVVGDPVGTEKNLTEMVNAGYKPVPVHVLGDTEEKMDELFEMSEYVALAGLKRPGKGHCPKSYVARKMQWAKGRKVHWLGYVVEKMIGAFQPFSVDSSSWSFGKRYGWAGIYLGQGRWSRKVQYESRERLEMTPELVSHLRRLGFDIGDFNRKSMWYASSENESKSIPHVTCIDGWVRYCVDIAELYGTRVFLACNLDSDDCDMIRRTIEGLNHAQHPGLLSV